jgi:predicted P-loop ATPase
MDEAISGGGFGALAELIDEADASPPIQPDADAVRDSVRDRLVWSMNKNGDRISPRPLAVNVKMILDNDPDFSSLIWLNSWSNTVMLGDSPIADADATMIRQRIYELYGFEPSKALCEEIIQATARQNAENPLINYINRLKWDGKSRIDDYLACGVAAKSGKMVKQFSRKWLIQAVARALRPGCKADCVLVLIGSQGIKKSTSFKALAGDEWFSDTPFDLNSKQAYMVISKAWIYELAEVEVLRRADNTAAKAFLSSPEDTFVPPYGRHPVSIKRHTVFCGTTNRRDFLTDPTGSRRYWPVECHEVSNLSWILENRDQLWAEAAEAFRSRERWWFETKEEIAEVMDAASMYREQDPWEAAVSNWARINGASGFTIDECLRGALSLDYRDMPRFVARASDLLGELGFIKEKQIHDGVTRRVWKRTGDLILMRSKKAAGDED